MISSKLQQIMRLIEFSDSAFPVGTFSFSNGLETASEKGLVYNAESLLQFTQSVAQQSAFTDGIACIHAYRHANNVNYKEILNCDDQVILCKMNSESRLMTQRMGKKLVELSKQLIDDKLLTQYLADINNGIISGTYPVAQGLLFSRCSISEEALFCSQQYGVINMVLSAALRCVRVSHYDTPRILFELSNGIDG